ncbi:DUF1707 domain-containing protein [Catellatospora sp. NPDC049111]|uniref:DUF1707 SHOCT-like domain-containing protein n=1 Tax=Catellatospora sp. NPDC049111 TaxID=3155271 RepID=UPI003411E6F2
MSNADETFQRSEGPPSDLRVGAPEREAALLALDEHLGYERLDPAEYTQRRAACQTARTESDLRRLFVDLPEPHPDLFHQPPAAPAADDVTALGWALGILLALGLPVTIVLGVVYDAWWSLTVPVALSVLLLYIEHLLTRKATGVVVADEA